MKYLFMKLIRIQYVCILILFFLFSCSANKTKNISKSTWEKAGLNGNVKAYSQFIHKAVIDTITQEILLGEIVQNNVLDSIGIAANVAVFFNESGYVTKENFMNEEKNTYKSITYRYNDENFPIGMKEFEQNEESAIVEIIYDRYNQVNKQVRQSKDSDFTFVLKYAHTQEENITTTTITGSVKYMPFVGNKFRAVTKTDSIDVFEIIRYNKDEIIEKTYKQRDEYNRKKQIKIIKSGDQGNKTIIQNYKYIGFDQLGNYTQYYIYIRNDESELINELTPDYIGMVNYEYFQ